jgi:hypothetical protein
MGRKMMMGKENVLVREWMMGPKDRGMGRVVGACQGCGLAVVEVRVDGHGHGSIASW